MTSETHDGDHDPADDATGVVVDFVQRLLEALDGGQNPSLTKWQSDYPGYEDLIAVEYAALVGGEASTAVPGDEPTQVVAAFERALEDDREGGRIGALSEYLRRFPGRETEIAARYVEIAARSDAAPVVDITPGGRFGTYRVERLLGRGGQGDVFEAVDERLGRRVALKVLHASGRLQPRAWERLRREAELLASLDHPGLCAVYEAGLHGGVGFLALRYVEGKTLAEALRDDAKGRARVDASRAWRDDVRLVEQVARALHVAHEKGIVHRDVKPGNIMLDDAGQPIVLDFGLAHAASDTGALTLTGDVLGTPAYMAPEQICGERVDRRTDVHALGVVLCECLTGRLPFEGATREQLVRAILERDAPDVRKRHPRLPAEIAAIVQCALEKSPDRRYRDALAFADDLAAVREGASVSVRPVGVARRTARWARRRPIAAALIGVLAIGLPLVTGLGGYLFAKQDDIALGESERERRAFEELVVDAYAELDEGDVEAARRGFDQALAERSDDVDSMAGRVLVDLRRRKWDAALERARRYAEKAREMRWLEATALGGKGEQEPAARLLAELGEPTTSAGWSIVGHLAVGRGHDGDEAAFRRALTCFDQAVLTSTKARALYVFDRAHAAGHCGDVRVARQCVALMTKQWPHMMNTWFWAGFALQHIDPAEAVGHFREAVRLGPEIARNHRALGFVLSETGDRDGARAAWEESLRIEPDEPSTLLNVALVHDEVGHDDEAERLLRRTTELHPGETLAWRRLGRFLLKRDRLDEARTTSASALERHPDNTELRLQAATMHADRGEMTEAEVHLKHAVATNPKSARAHYQLALIYGDRRDYRRALELHRKAVVLDPTFALAQEKVGLSLFALGRQDEGLAALAIVLEMDDTLVGPRITFAAIHLSEGRVGEARPHIIAALQVAPDSEIHGLLGNVLSNRPIVGRLGIESALRAAVGAASTSIRARLSLARLLETEGALTEAAVSLAQAHALAPNDLDVAQAYGRVLLLSGDPIQAERRLEHALTLELDRRRANAIRRDLTRARRFVPFGRRPFDSFADDEPDRTDDALILARIIARHGRSPTPQLGQTLEADNRRRATQFSRALELYEFAFDDDRSPPTPGLLVEAVDVALRVKRSPFVDATDRRRAADLAIEWFRDAFDDSQQASTDGRIAPATLVARIDRARRQLEIAVALEASDGPWADLGRELDAAREAACPRR